MHSKHPFRRFAMAFGLASLLFLLSVRATELTVQATPFQQDTTEQSGDVTEPIDVVVVLDDSGSMATCWPWPQTSPPFNPPCGYPSENPPSDPEELRYSAARLLLQLADDNDRLAVVRFDNLAGGVGDLGLLQPVGAGENRRRLTESLQPPTEYFTRGYTRIDLGLQSAIDILRPAREPGRSQYIILLTDGEPSQPGNVGSQQERVTAQIAELNAAGVSVFPVVLCNPTAGCAGEFLKARFAENGVREAASAQDLVRVFSEIFTTMKSDRSVLSGRNAQGALQFNTRAPHGVRKIALVTPRGGLRTLQRDGEAVLPQTSLDDPNIDVNWLEGEALAAGVWSAETSDFSGFAVVQTNSYPELLNPPPSIATSPASVRYYPAGKSLLLVARSSGPGAGEALSLNGKTQFQAWGASGLKALVVPETTGEIRLQLGDDKTPLQLVRTFQLEARRDLPRAEIFSPSATASGILENGRVRIQVGFAGNSGIQDVAATIFVSDESKDEQGGGKLVYQANLACTGSTCTDENFIPGDGRSYQITYLVQAVKDGLRFSDWGESAFSLKPAVYLRGLPAAFDLAQMPADGWPLEVGSGTTEEIGALTAQLTLRRLESEEAAQGASVSFSVDVPENGTETTALRVDGLDLLRPGTYEGEITFTVHNPAGRPMNNLDIRPTTAVPVTFFVPRPMARVDVEQVDFGETLFETSPNFRLAQEKLLPLLFEGKDFNFTVSIKESSCADITVAHGELQRQEGNRALLPLQLSSRGPIQPGVCSGIIALSGPTADYDIFPQEIAWHTRVNNIEWSIVSTALDLGRFQDAGTQAKATLLVRFSGKTPFILQMDRVAVNGRDAEGVVALDKAELEMPPVEVTGEPTEAGLYEVPVTFIARQPIPFDPLRGTFYNGELTVGVVGLADAPQPLGLSFLSPGLAQRYLAPYLLPVYSMPWVICTGPLTIFLLLMLMARVRGRDIDEEALEEAAVASTFSASSAGADAVRVETPTVTLAMPTSNESTWGAGEWGTAWGGTTTSDNNQTATSSNNSGSDDPWRAGW
ncbi:MAG: VWA domain-containing protein [Caldilineaceae bacterium]|nr:VWA domain-containing protein [Caldilineaceae bacterium]